MSRYVSLVALLGVLSIVVGLFLRVMSSFVLPLFLAALLFVVFRPLHAWIVSKIGGRHAAAAGLSTAAILLIVLVPLGWFFAQAGVQAFNLVTTFDRQALADRLVTVRSRLGLEMPPEYAAELEQLDALMKRIERVAGGGAGSGASARLSQFAAEALPVTERLEQGVRNRRGGGGEAASAEQSTDEKGTDEQFSANANDADADRNDANRNDTDKGSVDESRPPQAEATNDSAGATTPAEPPNESSDDEAAAPPPPWRSGLLEALARIQEEGDLDSQILAVEDARAGYRVLRQAVLGGPLKAWAIEWMNPSADVVSQARGAVLQQLEKASGPLAIGTTKSLAGFVIGSLVMTVTLFFLFSDGPGMLSGVIAVSPVEEEHVRRLLTDFDRVTRGVVAATLLSAAAQGVLAGVGYYVAGLPAAMLLAVLTGVLAMVPFVGAGAVWVPCSLWLALADERWLAASLLAVWGFFVVSMVDNLIKPLVLHGRSKMHPLLALLSVLGGVQTLGPIGIFVGPMAVAFLHSMLQIVRVEVSRIESERRAADDEDSPPADEQSEGKTTDDAKPPADRIKRMRWKRRRR